MVAVFQFAFLAFFTTYLTMNAEKHSSKPTFGRFKFTHTKIDKDVLQKWEFELDDKLDYPRGDKEKLRKISAQWSDYYACSSQLARSANAAAAVAVAVYEGAVARLPCGLCVAPGTSVVQWLRQKPLSASSQLNIDDRMIISDTGNLTIFKARVEDGGFYKCTIGHSAGGVVLLDVVDRSEPYDVVPCEKLSVFEVCSSDGAVLERANNGAGVFSLSQRLPISPPAPAREIVFAMRGQRVVLICPGTSLQDVPVTWRVGTKKLSPREADRASGGRVHLNARDDIVFTALLYEDANLYSCWQRDILVGTVKLTVWDTCPWQRHATLVAILVVVALVARALDNVLQRRRRRCGVA